MPVQFTLPPDTRAAGTGDPPNDANALIRAANAMGAPFSVLNATYAGGADPTGVADSLAAVNAAITAANAAGGGVVTIGPGVFSLSGSVAPLSNVTIAGAGPGATVLKLAAGANTHVIQNAAAITNVTLRDFAIDGNKANNATGGHNIRIGHGSSDIRIQNVYSHDASLHGIICEIDAAALHTRVVIRDCRSDSNGVSANGSGFYFNGVTGLLMSNCTAQGNQLDGFQWKTSTAINVSNLISGSNGRYGIFAIDGDANVSNVTVYSSGNIGVLVQQGVNANTILSLVNGQIYLNQQDGIRLDGVSNCSLANLRVCNNNQAGATNAGLRLNNLALNNRVTGCTFYDDQGVHTQRYGIWGTGASLPDYNVFSDCDTRGNTSTAVRQDSWGIHNVLSNVNQF